MPRRRPPPPPPGFNPRPATLGEAVRLLLGDRAHHGIPPGVSWTWVGFPEAWPYVRLAEGQYPGPTAAVGSAGDLWWFTLAEMMEHGDLFPSHWIEELAFRLTPLYTGWLKIAFQVLGSVPMVWPVPVYKEPRMAAYQPHYRLAFGGPLYVDEEWSCRLNITSSGDLPDDSEADDMLPDLVTALSTWVLAANSLLSSATGLSWVKFNEINAAGHYVNAGSSRVAEVNPIVYGPGSPALPPQVAVAVSLRTAHTRGKAHIGRMFTPALSVGVGSNGMHSAGTNLAGTATTLLNAINAVVTPAGVSIISSTGESNHVTRVAVGRVFDTMRTRRRSLSESPYDLGAALA